MSRFSVFLTLCGLLLAGISAHAQNLADVLSSIQERKQAVEQSEQLEVYFKGLNGQSVTVPAQELIEWEGMGSVQFPVDTDLSSVGIDGRIALLNQATAEFKSLQRHYLNIRAEDLVNGASLGAIRPYLREDFADPGRANADNYHATLSGLANQVLRLRVLPWPVAAQYHSHSFQVIKNFDANGDIQYSPEDFPPFVGWAPNSIGPLVASSQQPTGWDFTKSDSFLMEWVDTENYRSPDGSGGFDGLHCWSQGDFISKVKLLAEVPGQASGSQIGANVAFIARNAWTTALAADYDAPESWDHNDASYQVLTAATNSTGDISLPLPEISLNLEWHGGRGILSGFVEMLTATDSLAAQNFDDSADGAWERYAGYFSGELGHISLELQLHRHLFAAAAPVFSKGLNDGAKAANLSKVNKSISGTPGDAVPVLHPRPGILLGIPVGTGLDGGESAWIGWSASDTLFHADPPWASIGLVDEYGDPVYDDNANSMFYPFDVSGPKQLRFDHVSNLRFIGAKQDFHVVYETSRSDRGAQLPTLSPSLSKRVNSGWDGVYDRDPEIFEYDYDNNALNFFWKNHFFTAWDAPTLRQVVSRDFIIDITQTGHYAQEIKIYRRPANAGAVVRTPGLLITPDPANLIRTLVCENPDAGSEALPAVAEKIVMTDGDNTYEVWKDGLETQFAKNMHPLRFRMKEDTVERYSKVIEFPAGMDARVTTIIDSAPAVVDEIIGAWPEIDFDTLIPWEYSAGAKVGWNWWDYRSPLSIERTAGTKITQVTNTILETTRGSQNGAWPATSDITITNEPAIDLDWDASGRLASHVQGSWRTDYAMDGIALKAESKFNGSRYATTWTEWSGDDRSIKTYSAPDGSIASKSDNEVDWVQLTLGDATGTGLPGLPHALSRKDGSGAEWAWTVGGGFSGSLTVESGEFSGGGLHTGQIRTTAWNDRGFTISSQTSVEAGGTLLVSSYAVPTGQFTSWGAPEEWKNLLTGLSTKVTYEPGLSRPGSVESPLGLTTNLSNYDSFNRPGQVQSNGITATHNYTGLGVNTTYSGSGIGAGAQSSISGNVEGTAFSQSLTWGGITQSSDTVRGASATTITGNHSLFGAATSTLRNDDGSLTSADDATLPFGGLSGDALSVTNGLLVTKTAVADQTGTFTETHSDAWGRPHKIVTPSKSGTGSTQTDFAYSLPGASLKRVITTVPDGSVYITESEDYGTIVRKGIDVGENGSLGGADRYVESVTTVDNGQLVTTQSMTEDIGQREFRQTEWTAASGVTVVKMNGSEETITSTPDYISKNVATTSSKGWTQSTDINSLGLVSENALSGTGVTASASTLNWRPDGSLEGLSLNRGGDTHTADFDLDGTLASVNVPGRGNILGAHSIGNGVETLTLDGVTREVSLDGTDLSISGGDEMDRDEVLITSGGGYKKTVTPAVGAPTESTFNDASALTSKTYADSSVEFYSYSNELLSSVTLARGGAVAYAYSGDGARDLTSIDWPQVASGPFTIAGLSHGFTYNRSGGLASRADPSGTRSFGYYNGRLSSTSYTGGLLGGYEVIRALDTAGRHTGTTLNRDGAPVHSIVLSPNGVSDQITGLASGPITATPQRDGAGNITGYLWSDGGTHSVTQTWTRGPGGRIESAGSDVPGAPAFDYLLDPEHPEQSFDSYGRRLKCATAGGTWTYTYGTWFYDENTTSWVFQSGVGGQLASATHPTLGSFTYQFDGIGRRIDHGTENTTDLLNRSVAWTHDQNKTLTIKADPSARVWFNGVEVANFSGSHQEAVTPPGPDGGWVPWNTLAVLEGAGDGAGDPAPNPLASPDAEAELSGAVWVPPLAETLTYDLAGNRQSSAPWDYGWNAKNQLARIRTKDHDAATTSQAYDITFTYDAEGRRVKKHVVEYQSGTVVAEKNVTYLWDGWDLLYERHQLPSGLTLLERSYLWGPDIADGKAGGAGGLLLIREKKGDTTTDIIPLYDGTGHVVALTDIEKNLLAEYAYGPFGEKIAASGPRAQSNPWRWGTKYRDPETGLYYFGHRYFDPVTGQWLSREPLGESESINLYLFAGNDPINNVDVLGLMQVGLLEIPDLSSGSDFISVTGGFDHVQEAINQQVADNKLIKVMAYDPLIEGVVEEYMPMRAYIHARERAKLNADTEIFSLLLGPVYDAPVFLSTRFTDNPVYRAYGNEAGFRATIESAITVGTLGVGRYGGTAFRTANGFADNISFSGLRGLGGDFGEAISFGGLNWQPTPSLGVMPKGTRRSSLFTANSSDIVFRRVSEAERGTFLSRGLRPTGSGSAITPTEHILGIKPSPSISATRDYNVALGNYGRGGTPIVEIDLSKVPASYTDFTVPQNLNGLGSSRAVYNATRDAEVLIHGAVPPEALGRIHYP